MDAPASGPSTLRAISGPKPGLLDPDQPTRLLRVSGSRLSFASFHPHTASAQRAEPDLGNLSLNEELYRPKRVVVETTPSGDSFWRFVPKARWENGVQDEGAWPRVIDLCGEPVYCSQDQWDIYKLDPAYDCFVPLAPRDTIIAPAGSLKLDVLNGAPYGAPRTAPPPRAQAKHRLSTSPRASRSPTPSERAKKLRTNPRPVLIESDDSIISSDDELEEDDDPAKMAIDGGAAPGWRRSRSASVGPRDRTQRMRQQMEEARKLRREKVAKAEAKRGANENEALPSTQATLPKTPRLDSNTMPPPPTTGKRKGPSLFDFSRSANSSQAGFGDCEEEVANKRARTRSPTSVRRDLNAKRDSRQAQKPGGGKRHKPTSFMEEVLADILEETTQMTGDGVPYEPKQEYDTAHEHEPAQGSQPSSQSSAASTEIEEDDEESARRAAIAESQRKLADLERDRPLWEAAAKQRAASEQAEETTARTKAKLEHQAREAAEARAKAEREREAKAARERAAAEATKRRQAEEEARREADRRRRQREQHQRERERFAFGPWTMQRALERYRALSDTFDVAKFDPENPLAFDGVPWPVLHSPVRLTVEDIDWSAVEAFFEAVRPSMRPQDYRQFVEKSQRRFHPDRWRSRGLLKSVANEEERESMEVAANTVAQAITPLWRALPR